MTKAEMQARYRESIHMIPSHMREGITQYVEHGREQGGFLMALLRNEEDSYLRADPVNLAAMEAWAKFLSTALPEDCHGSALMVAVWMKMGGLDGYPDRT